MRQIPLLLFFILSLIAGSCSKEEIPIRVPTLETPVITGFNYIDFEGYMIGQFGNPNVHTSEYSFKMFVYPIPASHFITCEVHGFPNDQVKIIWLIKAQFSEEIPSSLTNLGMHQLRAGGNPQQVYETNSNGYVINTREFEPGFYRIYVQSEDILLFDNIVIYKDL